jgi:uncharacterized membrane protein
LELVFINIPTPLVILFCFLLAIATATCFCFSYKKSGDFSENEVHFKNPWYNYLVLFITVLRYTFIGYFQYAISFENSNDSLTTLIFAIIAVAMAYYFDN